MRTICAVTVGRSDFGCLRPVLEAIQTDPELTLQLIVSGAHLSPEFGWTVNEIAKAGFEVHERVDMLTSSDTPPAIAKSMGLGVIGFAQAYERLKPDMLMVLGDRFEMHAAAVAAVPFRIPIAHIHGGELTQGAIDDAFRHSITKCSHLHFVATDEYAARVIQMGEEPWRVTVSGAPALDNLHSMKLLPVEELCERVGLSDEKRPLMVTYHPVTLQYEQTEWQTEQLLAALAERETPIVFTKPNADTNGRIITRLLEKFAARHANVRVVDNLGTQAYFSLMKWATAMVGNSSSGIIEAASFDLPVVNIGIRQQGRTQSGNVIDVSNDTTAIAAGLDRALDPSFASSLHEMINVYGTGRAADSIVERLKSVQLGASLITKCFYEADDHRTEDAKRSHESSPANSAAQSKVA